MLLGRWLPAASLAALVLAAAAVRVGYADVRSVRAQWSADRAEQGRKFTRVLHQVHADHEAYHTMMTAAVSERDRAIRQLGGTIRLAERRADEAERKARRDAERAAEIQGRFVELLDGVLSTAEAKAVIEEPDAALAAEQDQLPTIVDLLAWEDKVTSAMVDDLRDASAGHAGGSTTG